MKNIYVTQPSLPPLEDFVNVLEEIWKSRVLTNGGPLHQELESQLCSHLGVENISLFSNGTIALVTALQSLRISGEVITTPYSFVATAHSLLWNGIKPVFVDIDPVTLSIDPKLIEAAITPQTTAILPVHCYGLPSDTKAIAELADTYNLKVIYDAAHSFGVNTEDGSLLAKGDLSVLSFHATKVFNTFEGGAIISPTKDAKRRIDRLKNFGFVDEITVTAPGINGKMSEVNAGLGLLQLKKVESDILRRGQIDNLYRSMLADKPGIRIVNTRLATKPNFSYFPILVDKNFPISRDQLYEHLKSKGIFSRRYFYPLISEFPMYRSLPSSNPSNLPVAFEVSRQVLCLPIYPDLPNEDVIRICNEINSVK